MEPNLPESDTSESTKPNAQLKLVGIASAVGLLTAIIGGYVVSEHRIAEAQDAQIELAEEHVRHAEQDLHRTEAAVADIMAGDLSGYERIPAPSFKPPPDLLLMMRQNVEQMEMHCREYGQICEQATLQRKHYQELMALP